MADVLVDASALVALLDRDDRSHAVCAHALSTIRDELVTVWPALTEAIHLLGDYPTAEDALFEMIEDGVLRLATLDGTDVPRMKALMRKYRDTPMDFAAAALVRVAERDRLNQILSFDRHFLIYACPAARGSSSCQDERRGWCEAGVVRRDTRCGLRRTVRRQRAADGRAIDVTP